MNDSQILLLNFEKLVQKSLYEMLCRAGHKVDIANSLDEFFALIDEKLFHIVLTDLKGPGDIESLKTIKEKTINAEIIILTSYGNLENAVNCIKIGAFDYLVRPIKDKKILSTIERALADKILAKKKPALLKRFSNKKDTFHGLIGNSEKTKEMYSIVERIADSKATVLLYGESGTGKRLLAHSIHKVDKKRRHKPFIEVSCGALPREIIESELFGHTKGAFTGAINDRKGRFELAHGSTMLLDDIDTLPLDLQVKLLRVLQQKEFERVGDQKTLKVDVRIVAATNQNLEKLVAEKRFREDLYYRLNVISIEVPSLRDRKDDLPLLINHFVDLYSKENHKKIKYVSEEVLEALMNYKWPGNIRELENIIERAVILDTDNIIKEDDLPEVILKEKILLTIESGREFIKNIATTLKDVLKEPEKVHILRVLKEVGWNKKKAARQLGVNRTTLYNKLRKHNLTAFKTEK